MKNSERFDMLVIKIGRSCFKYSLLVGVQLLLWFAATKHKDIPEIGICFIIIAFLSNSLVLAILLILTCSNRNLSNEKMRTMGLMVLNIPIAIFCILITITLI